MRSSFVYFRPFLDILTLMIQNLTINGKIIDGVLGSQTWDCRMVGVDRCTEP